MCIFFRYAETVLPIQLTSQKYNPEVPWISQTTTDAKITEMVEKLRHTEKVNDEIFEWKLREIRY